MRPRCSSIAGLVLALPSAAALAQDNPWRVPSASSGYAPGYEVQQRDQWSTHGAPSPQPRSWAPAPNPGPRYSWVEDYDGAGRPQRRGAGVAGWAHYPYPPYGAQPEPRDFRGYEPSAPGDANRPPQQAYRSAPPAPQQDRYDGAAYPQYAPIEQYPPSGGYGEYPPLDERKPERDRREPAAWRESRPREWERRAAPPPAPPYYGPSTLGGPYAGLPGLGGYGYGGLPGGPYGYPSSPYPWGW